MRQKTIILKTLLQFQEEEENNFLERSDKTYSELIKTYNILSVFEFTRVVLIEIHPLSRSEHERLTVFFPIEFPLND